MAVDMQQLMMFVLRWVHFVAGITWIGLLYFFNLVNVPFMKTIDAPTKGQVVTKLLTRGLWWFRWSAVLTVVAGILLMDGIARVEFGGWTAYLDSPRGQILALGGAIGIIMALNVWLIIWPNQRRVIAATEATMKQGTPAPPEQAMWGRKAFLASRANFVLSLPMLGFMAASSHFTDLQNALLFGILVTVGGLAFVWYLGQPKPAAASTPASPSAPPLTK